MANIVITTTNAINVDFGVYSTTLEFSKGSWRKDNIINIKHLTSCIEVNVLSEKEWLVSFDGAGTSLQIDSIDGVAPTSNSDLYDKLIALIA